MTEPARPEPARGQRPVPKAITAARLERAAVAYLERYSSSTANLRRVLERRIVKVTRLRGEDPVNALALIDPLIDTLRRSGLLDDRIYAGGKVAALRRRGHSARLIEVKLTLKGVDRDLAHAAIDADPTDDGEAARRLARKRRLGPWRQGDRRDKRDRDIAVLARAGFPLALARAVIDGDADDEPA